MKTIKSINIKVGLFGIGLETYWPQFEGLLERLEGYQKQVAEKIESFGAEVINVGLVDSPVKAREKAQILKTENINLN